MAQKQVVIVGAGISGLTAAYYAAKAGHKVKVFERNQIPGGVSTGWKRKGYFFEGGMHWLMGSTPRMMYHKYWLETGAITKDTKFSFKDPVFTYVNGDTRLHMWRSMDKCKAELMAFAPEDKRAIARLCRQVKTFAVYAGEALSAVDWLKRIVLAIPFACMFVRLFRVSTIQYISKFKNPDVRNLLTGYIDTYYNAVAFIFTLSGYEMGDSGFPEGGSVRMAANIADSATAAGAEILYRRNVEKVLVENGAVSGVKVDGETVPADNVIMTVDARAAMDRFFDQPIHEKWAENIRHKAKTQTSMFLSIGVKADLGKYPEVLRPKLKEALVLAGLSYEVLWVNNYSWKNGYAPEGCSTVTVILTGDSYDWWKAAKEDGSYNEKKAEVTDAVVNALCAFIPEIEGNVEVTDLATPLTYERYCGTWRGSWMNAWTERSIPIFGSTKCKSIKGLQFCGQRTLLAGGLPVALMTGRGVALSIK